MFNRTAIETGQFFLSVTKRCVQAPYVNDNKRHTKFIVFFFFSFLWGSGLRRVRGLYKSGGAFDRPDRLLLSHVTSLLRLGPAFHMRTCHYAVVASLTSCRSTSLPHHKSLKWTRSHPAGAAAAAAESVVLVDIYIHVSRLSTMCVGKKDESSLGGGRYIAGRQWWQGSSSRLWNPFFFFFFFFFS